MVDQIVPRKILSRRMFLVYFAIATEKGHFIPLERIICY